MHTSRDIWSKIPVISLDEIILTFILNFPDTQFRRENKELRCLHFKVVSATNNDKIL